MNSSKLIYPTLLISAVAVMMAYLESPMPSLGAAFVVFALLLAQLAVSRRTPQAPLVPPEFQAKLGSLEHQNHRQIKLLADAQTQTEGLQLQIKDLEKSLESLRSQNASYEAATVNLQNALKQSEGGDEQAVIQFVRNLQSRGRFLDFVMADIHKLPDTQVGAVSRVVHQGLRELMEDYFKIQPIAPAAEGDVIAIPRDNVGKGYSLVQSRSDDIPEQGRLLHRGWQAARMKLPQSQKHETSAERLILAPAEVDVSEIH